MTQRLNARDLARALVSARVELSSAESTLNALNVFPVPDGDTGTNMRAPASKRASSHSHRPVRTTRRVGAPRRSSPA